MKKVILSTLAALTLTTSVAVAGEPVEWYSKASKLKFSGLTYLGYTHTDFKNDAKFKNDSNLTAQPMDAKDGTDKFQMRRAYVQIKAYLLEDPKSYFRVTLDMEHDDSDKSTGDYNVRFKYAYLYLNEILPFTGVEMGIVHRPWIDYEEHNSWFYRDTHWVFVEAGNAAKLTNSADLGFNFKTKTEYFSSEVGIFNGEGYHDNSDGDGVSAEWRFTGHILGKHKKDAQNTETYWDASFYGQYNMKNHKYQDFNENQDLVWGGLHTVFNMPMFMLGAQYVESQNTIDSITGVTNPIYNKAGKGYNAHAIFRLGDEKQFRLVARYDHWTPEKLVDTEELSKNTYYAGFVWEQSDNVEWVANYLQYANDLSANNVMAVNAKDNSSSYMLTAQVKF